MVLSDKETPAGGQRRLGTNQSLGLGPVTMERRWSSASSSFRPLIGLARGRSRSDERQGPCYTGPGAYNYI